MNLSNIENDVTGLSLFESRHLLIPSLFSWHSTNQEAYYQYFYKEVFQHSRECTISQDNILIWCQLDNILISCQLYSSVKTSKLEFLYVYHSLMNCVNQFLLPSLRQKLINSRGYKTLPLSALSRHLITLYRFHVILNRKPTV